MLNIEPQNNFCNKTGHCLSSSIICTTLPLLLLGVMKHKNVSWIGHVAWMGAWRNLYKIFIRRPEQKRPFGRPTDWWEDST